MKQFASFVFDSYSWNPSTGTIELRYSLDDSVHFTETLTLPSPPQIEVPQAELDAALFALHLIGGISYYKTCLPKTIEIRSGSLNEEQATFWNSVYENGLGEFFYRNNVDFKGLINFPHHQTPSAIRPSTSSGRSERSRALVPIGGGKDSIVAMERLRERGDEITLLRMGGHPLIEEIARVAGLPLLTIKRALSPKLFELNEQGALNGHIPITAYLSCVTVVIALLYDFDLVAMSNEKSANIPNVEYRGMQINHQWSKSEEFERAFQAYVQKYVTDRVEYKSELRSMSELEIVREFVKHPQYFSCTTSCNTNWKIVGKKNSGAAMNPSPSAALGTGSASGSWCGKCPKCAFVFALYAAVLPKNTLEEIFGRNLFRDDWLMPLYRELLGLEGFKPFECVGTPEETKDAFRLALQRGDLDDTPVMKMFRKECT